jgi:hypothetical protein
LHADISAANVDDHRLLEDMVDGITPIRQPAGRPRKRPAKLHGDQGYDCRTCRQALVRRRIKARIARRGIESSTALAGIATSSNAAWSGPPGSGTSYAATNARLPTSSDSCAWPALQSATTAPPDWTCRPATTPNEMRSKSMFVVDRRSVPNPVQARTLLNAVHDKSRKVDV